jgi:hypothetical protein
MIEAKYEIKTENVEQEISLSSIKHLLLRKLIKLGPNMTAIVEITQKLTPNTMTLLLSEPL